MLGKRLIEELDRGIEVALALICGTDPTVCLCDDLEVCTNRPTLVDSLFARGDALVVFTLLKLNSCNTLRKARAFEFRKIKAKGNPRRTT